MSKKRKALSKTVRFEVFKRDKFTCQYCGKQAPDVVLHVDHIHPVSKGGEDTMLNYITSCEGCNAGKGARTLSDDSRVAKQRAEVAQLAEKREQIEMMLEWHRLLGTVRDQELSAIERRWSDLTAFGFNEYGRTNAKKWLRKFALADLLSAMELAVHQYGKVGDDGKFTFESMAEAFHKIPGVCRLAKLPADERELYYIRGILRKRLTYCDELVALQMLREALACGVQTSELKEIAKVERSWNSWVSTMNQYISADREVGQ